MGRNDAHIPMTWRETAAGVGATLFLIACAMMSAFGAKWLISDFVAIFSHAR